jgi:prepilin peptidase CpaA
VNLVTGAPVWLAGLLLLTLIAAVVEDASRLRISNLTCLAVLVEAIVAVAVEGFSPLLWQNGAALVCVLVFGTAAFAAGLLGGGDVKLLAALALWVDLQRLVWLVAAIFIAGGAVALIYIFARLTVPRLRKSKRSDRRIPYGLAIAAGALFVFAFQRPELQRSPQPLPALKLAHLAR